MKKTITIYKKTPLVLRILAGLIIGVLLGIIVPQIGFLKMIGELFVGALKAIAPVLVLFLVISSLSSAGKGIGGRFSRVIMLYLLSTFLAAAFAVAMSFVFPVSIPLSEAVSNEAPTGLGEVFSNLLSNMVMNPVSALANGNYVGILFWSVVGGLAVRSAASDRTKEVLSDLAESVSKVISGVIQFAPIGILGLVYGSVGEYGMSIFVDYGKLLLVLVGCMLIVFLIIDPLLVFICIRRNPYPLVWRCIKDSGVSAFFTRSSAVNIPINMELCRKLGLEKEYYSVAIPLGATINMDGAAITITVLSLAAAYTCGVEVNFITALLLSFVAALGACGASGVAGGSLMLIPMACSLLNVPSDIAMQMVAVGFIIGVIQDSLETAVNSSGDVMFTATAEYMEWKKQGREFKVGRYVENDK